MASRLSRTIVPGAVVAVLTASPALSACPIELAVYREDQAGSMIDFRPGETGIVSNAFRMVLRNDVMLDGFVMWTENPERPYGTLMHECPEGDVTGEEIAACTVWEGVIYTADASGSVSTLPGQGTDAPQTLIFPDLARAVRLSSAYARIGADGLPWDAFALSGCQE